MNQDSSVNAHVSNASWGIALANVLSTISADVLDTVWHYRGGTAYGQRDLRLNPLSRVLTVIGLLGNCAPYNIFSRFRGGKVPIGGFSPVRRTALSGRRDVTRGYPGRGQSATLFVTRQRLTSRPI